MNREGPLLLGYFAFFYIMTTTEKDAIIEILTPMLDMDGIELVDVEMHGQTLRLLIHKQGGLSVADCQAVNHVVHPILEVHEHLASYAQLEVASPGIDRPLRTANDFRRNCGRTVQIEVASESGNVQGTVVEVHPESVVLAQTGGKRIAVQISQIRNAHIHLKW